jgi:hypothetical protein
MAYDSSFCPILPAAHLVLDATAMSLLLPLRSPSTCCYFFQSSCLSPSQAYPHKILTGRRSRMHTIRQTGGLAGFTKRSESEYDCFGAGHSSTTISAGLGELSVNDIFVC